MKDKYTVISAVKAIDRLQIVESSEEYIDLLKKFIPMESIETTKETLGIHETAYITFRQYLNEIEYKTYRLEIPVDCFTDYRDDGSMPEVWCAYVREIWCDGISIYNYTDSFVRPETRPDGVVEYFLE